MKAIHSNKACEAASAAQTIRANPPRRILVAEDDDEIRCLNTEVLIHHGYRVDAVKNGAAAWDALQQNAYDLLVTDNKMPKMTGIELLQKLCAARMELPVIMATGTVPEKESIRDRPLNPAVLLIKPYSLDDLLDTVVEVLHGTEATTVESQALSRCEQ